MGVLALALALVAGCSSEAPEPAAEAEPAPALPEPPAPVGPPTAVVLEGIIETARGFLQTAVLRTDLERAWETAAPELRTGYTKAKWLTGSIPIVPYPKDDFGEEEITVLEAKADDVFLSVLVRPRAGSDVLPVEYYVHLVPVGGAWLVSYWAPSGRQAGLPGF